MVTHIKGKSWSLSQPPSRILAMRFHAFGDVVITLPYLQGLRRRFPEARIDFLSVDRAATIPAAIRLFDQVYTVKGGKSLRQIAFWSLLRAPRLLAQQYEVVIDLQNNSNSRRLRKLLTPESWVEFEKYAPLPAGERNRLTLEALGFPIEPVYGFTFKDQDPGLELLHQRGWKQGEALIVLNPAGFFPTRNWPLPYYLELGRLFLQGFPRKLRLLLLGIDLIADKAAQLQAAFGDDLINLTGQTTQVEALSILQQASLVVSEDSGLMHMAWVSGVPTLALLGSTRSDWTRPLGPHSAFLDSSDLPCGNCMSASCIHGDVRCLRRYRPEMVFEKAMEVWGEST